MSVIKKLLRPRVIVWAATTVVLTGVLIAADYFAMNKYVKLIEGTQLGGDTPIPDPNSKGNAFVSEFDTKDKAFNNGNDVTKKICEEGMILLKNDDNALPLAKNAKVTVFGRNSIDLVYGGSGSAAPGKSSDAAINKKYGWRKTLNDSLTEAGFSVNPEMAKFYEKQSGRSSNPDMENSGVATLKTGETAYDKYTDAVKKSYDAYNDAAIVVFSRIAGENWDLPRQADDNANRHYLELDNNERELLRQIGKSQKFKKIIVLVNGSNYIDLGFLYERTNATDYNDFGKYINAVINIGSPGANGIMALGEILDGTVNPSGHTVDTVYTQYQNDPTWQNFGGNTAFNNQNGTDNYTRNGSASKYYLVEYEENIYLGYRYYETRGAVEGEEWYNKNVVYPFGYGLSYTSFEQEITNVSALEGEALQYDATTGGKKFTVSVKVKNIGDVAGKQVVQLYASAPYTAGGIEKAHKVLVGFAKTKELKKNETDTVEIEVDPYDFASFDSQDKNNNGFKGYELEKGEYTFYAGTDAHNSFAQFKKNLAADVKIEKDPVTGNKVEPLFPEVTAHMNPAESLSRNNFAGTFPKFITDAERALDEETYNALRSKETTNNETYDKLPTMGAEYKVSIRDLAGKAYNDPMWDQFLDQLTFDEMLKLFNDGCYSTAAIERKMRVVDEETGEEKEKNVVIIPGTTSADGPTGIVGFLGDPAIYGCCYYCSECLVAQTYNVELADLEAEAIGSECLVGNEKGGGLAYPGWYAPGVNLHRSPFSGRNTEYYSEDPFLNGRFAGRVIKGVSEMGVYANVKHFAVNDQETHRSTNGIATWLDEQAMRELYLKPFEMAVKEGEAKGLMTSFNRIGTEWAGGSYRLVTTILRKEWGFKGSVICDFHTDFYMDSKQMLYAGGDLNLVADKEQKLQTSNKYSTPYVKADNAKDAHLLRRSAHNNLYALANSCALKVDIIGYKTAWWKTMIRVIEIAIPVCLAAWGFAVIFTSLRKKEEPAPKAE